MSEKRADIIAKLQQDILLLQGFKPADSISMDMGLGALNEAFPGGTFPIGTIHEFLSEGPESAAATNGFVSGMLSPLMKNGGVSLWIASSRKLFPPALINFGIQPDRFIFIDLQNEKQVIWAMEEALKCSVLTAVVGEVREISFTTSRRLQLAVEQSKVTGFILRNNFRQQNTTACVSRWKISALPSIVPDGLPGIGFPHWRVELLRIRNGKTGIWDIKWQNGRFNTIERDPLYLQAEQKKTG